ncbi:MAG: TetR family transcriptional regulator [Fidelibacterota bacterium]
MNESLQNQRKEQILDAALKVLIQKGYEQSRMDDVVDVSKLSKGAIYWYYKSKKEMYLDLVNYWVLHYSVTLNHIVEENAPPSRQLQDLFQYFIDQYESDPQPFFALTEFWSMSQKDIDFKNKLQKVYTNFLELIEGIIEQGVTSGEFKQLNVRMTALSIMVNIESINWFTLFDEHGVSVREYIGTITDFIQSGIAKK